MANTYQFFGPGERWAEDDPTAEDYLNVARENADHLHEALNSIMDTDAADGALSLTGNITMADDTWIGLGAAKGRIVFDDTPATDYINLMSSHVGIGSTNFGWDTTVSPVLEIGTRTTLGDQANAACYWTYNAYYNSGWKGIADEGAVEIAMSPGAISMAMASANGVGGAIAFTTMFSINSTGNTTFKPNGTTNNIVIADSSDATSYSTFTLNGNITNAGMMGLLGGGGSDASLYVQTPSGGDIYLRVGASEKFRVKSSGDVYIQPTAKFYLDGGGDTYISEVAANVINFVSLGAEGFYFNGNQVNWGYNTNANDGINFNFAGYQSGATQFRDLSIFNGKGAAMSVWDGSAACIYHYNNTSIQQGNVIFFDTDLDTYIYASADDVVDIYAGGSKRWTFTSGNMYSFGAFCMGGNALYLDADNDTYISGAVDDVIRFQNPSANIYFNANTINTMIDVDDDTQALTINYFGYNNSSTRFRDLHIANGKTTDMSFWDGSASTITHYCYTLIHDGGISTSIGEQLTLQGSSAGGHNGHASLAIKAESTAGYAYITYMQGVTRQWEVGISASGDALGGDLYYISPVPQTGAANRVLSITTAGVVNLSNLTASQDVQTDGSKNLVSVSDARWKIDRGGIDNALETVRKITPRYFRWNRSATERFSDEHIAAQPTLAGFYSQDVYAAFPAGSPGGANTDAFGNDHWGLNNRALTALNMSAIQELDGKVSLHESRFETLEEKVERLESENEAKDKTISELRADLNKLAA